MEITLTNKEIYKIVEDHLKRTFNMDFVQSFVSEDEVTFSDQTVTALRPVTPFDALAKEVFAIRDPGNGYVSTKINRIKRIREITNCGLKSAKDYVEALMSDPTETYSPAFQILADIPVSVLNGPWETWYTKNNVKKGW